MSSPSAPKLPRAPPLVTPSERPVASVDVSDQRRGTWYAIAAYGLWGVLPLYLVALRAAQPLEILAHRVIWSFLLPVGVLVYWTANNLWTLGQQACLLRRSPPPASPVAPRNRTPAG